MTKSKSKGEGGNDEIVKARPRLTILPPEIIRMIFQYLASDKETLCACSRTAHEFRHIILPFLGRHLTVNNVDRLKECTRMMRRGAFQHVRSLDLGIDNKWVIQEDYWRGYIIILGLFARYRALNRLWLSEVPFIFLKQNQKKKFKETITALGSTVTELGLYGCHFSSYEQMISLIRAFPRCEFLFIRDSITGDQVTGVNSLARLPKHRLAVKDLHLSASSSSDFLIDVSNLIEDAALDVGSLTSLLCDVGTSERTQRVAAAVLSSPVEQFQVACTQPEGFQAFKAHLSKWTLTSLTIGPQTHETNTEFWVESFKDLSPLPRVDNVTIIYHYPRATAFNTDCWEFFDRILTRADLFPALKSVHARPTSESPQLIPRRWPSIYNSLRRIEAKGLGPHIHRR